MNLQEAIRECPETTLTVWVSRIDLAFVSGFVQFYDGLIMKFDQELSAAEASQGTAVVVESRMMGMDFFCTWPWDKVDGFYVAQFHYRNHKEVKNSGADKWAKYELSSKAFRYLNKGTVK